jgi:hypothetical protein
LKSSWIENAQTAAKTAHFSDTPPGGRSDALENPAVLRLIPLAPDAGPAGLLPGDSLQAATEALPMPFEIRDEGSFYFTRLSGVLDPPDLKAVTTEIERLEDEGPPKDRVTDFTAVERIDVGFEEVFALAMRRAQRVVRAPIRSALVAKKPVHFGFARMFQMLNDNPRIQIRIFATADEAVQWLSERRSAPHPSP